MAIVAEGDKSRLYISPNEEHIRIAESAIPEWEPTEEMNTKCTDLVSGRGYGITHWRELFTNRQLTALATYIGLISEAQKRAEQDALSLGIPDDGVSLADGGKGAKAYGEAVGVYLSFGLSRLTDIYNSFCRWEVSKTQVRNLFGRQAIPMIWDYAENNVFAGAAGDYTTSLNSIVKVLERFENTRTGIVKQFDAQSDNGLRDIMISTDPPYYDNISYADLSDFFYIWLRKCLKSTYPKLFRTMLVPKAEELVATAYRFDGSKQKAKEFFEDGMYHTCQQLYLYAREDIPVTVYYAYRQSDTENDATASTGWETMLSSIIRAGFAITGTWPMRTELANRTVASGTNALSSSIVLVCRKRPESATGTTRRGFTNELRRELRSALSKLQSSNIAPVDLA